MYLWWIYVVGMVVVAWVIFQAWDSRRNDERGASDEKVRVDAEAARHVEVPADAKQPQHSAH